MKSLIYLTLTTLKNRIIDLKRHPSKLILTLFVVVMLGFVVVTSLIFPPEAGETYRPVAELYAIILALYMSVFGLGAMQGLSSGASFFSMADVHFVFPAPISSRRVLLYGLVKQMSTSLYVGFFLLFQFSWLHQSYGISFGTLLLILLGYCLCMFTSQLTAMSVYVFTSHNERKQNLVRGCFYAVYGLFALYLILPAFQNKDNILGAVTGAANTPIAALLPVAGWLKAAVTGCLTGDWMTTALGLSATLLFGLALIFAIAKARGDFYEDVLQATEVSFSAITAKKEGNLEGMTPKNVKVGKQGIGKGFGASAFFYKHMLENRRSRFLMIDKTSLILAGVVIGFSYFMKEDGLLPVLLFSTYMQIFGIATGRWVRELLLPYVYLAPEPPFIKLLYLCLEGVCKIVVEAVLLFIPVGIILSLTPVEIIACILMRIGFGLLLLAGNILIERIFGSIINKVIIMLLYFFVLFIICIPGVIIGFVLNAALGNSGLIVPLVATFVWNALWSLLIVFLCRNILNYAELNNR